MKPWTPASTHQLTALWTNGKSTREIAEALERATGFSYTRNMIVGRVTRLKLPRRGRNEGHTDPVKRAEVIAERRAASTPKRPNKFVATYIPEDAIDRRPPLPHAWQPLPGTEPQPLAGHQAGTCIWPVGPDDQPYQFCCAPLDPKGTYCPEHRKMAFKPAPVVKFNGRKQA